MVALTILGGCRANPLPSQSMPSDEPATTLMSGLGNLHHPIGTSNTDAQQFFDQGLKLVYAFNFAEAIKSFQRASQLDPNAPMPYWGLALASGPNYTDYHASATSEKAAFNAIHKAWELASTGPATDRDYVAALLSLFIDDPHPDVIELDSLSRNYANAMRELALKYPDDPDASTLFAESLMDLHPHKLWNVDGKPGQDTSEILSTLRSVLLRWPDHIGANHLLIHVVEASPNPLQGLASATRLQTLAAGAGHLVHMPAHIYFRIGDYTAAMQSTRDAAATDEAYLENGGNSNTSYRIAYADHNLRLFVAAASMAGNFRDAYDVANHLHQSAATYAANFPIGEDYMAVRILLLVRFNRWTDVLSSPQPSPKFMRLTFYWHYARGCAFAAQRQAEQAKVESAAMENTYEIMETRASHALSAEIVNENTIALESLEARVASARGDETEAIAHYRLAVAAEDILNYHEPPLWYYPVRESLGAALFRDRQMKEAEKVFRRDLLINPNNPRSLYGLWKVLESVHNANAAVIGSQFKRAWKASTSALTFQDF